MYLSSHVIRVIKSRRMKWAGYVAFIKERRGVYRFLVGKPEGKSPLRRHRRRREDKINMDLRGVEWETWTGLISFRISTGDRLL